MIFFKKNINLLQIKGFERNQSRYIYNSMKYGFKSILISNHSKTYQHTHDQADILHLPGI